MDRGYDDNKIFQKMRDLGRNLVIRLTRKRKMLFHGKWVPATRLCAQRKGKVKLNLFYKVGDDVVVMGGGLAGCECAIHLGMEGKNVHLVEMRDMLAPDANVRHRPLMLAEIDKYVTVHTGCRALRVTEHGVVCADQNGNEILVPGKSVICALGQRSRSDVVTELQDTAPFVRVIGDASRVSTITNAVYWGYHAALDI